MDRNNTSPTRRARWGTSSSASSSASSSTSSSPPRFIPDSPVRPIVYPDTPMPQTVQLPSVTSFYPLPPLYPAAPRYPHSHNNELQLSLSQPAAGSHYQPNAQRTSPMTPPRSNSVSPVSYREFRPHFWAPEDDSYNPPSYPSSIATSAAGFDPNWTPSHWPPASPTAQLAPLSSSPPTQALVQVPATSSSSPIASSPLALKFQIAPYLSPNLRHPNDPHLVWNVTERPEKCKRVTSRGCLVPFMGTALSATQATSPRCDSVEVWIPYMRPCWGPAIVSASTSDGVTISDVLVAIYNYLQTPIHSEDVSALTKLPQGQAIYLEICSTFEKRCDAAPGLPGFERKQGVRRVDFLRDEVGFWGMWQKKRRDGSSCLVARFCAPTSVTSTSPRA